MPQQFVHQQFVQNYMTDWLSGIFIIQVSGNSSPFKSWNSRRRASTPTRCSDSKREAGTRGSKLWIWCRPRRRRNKRKGRRVLRPNRRKRRSSAMNVKNGSARTQRGRRTMPRQRRVREARSTDKSQQKTQTTLTSENCQKTNLPSTPFSQTSNKQNTQNPPSSQTNTTNSQPSTISLSPTTKNNRSDGVRPLISKSFIISIILTKIMSSQDNLLGFLKKKSLFNQSPQRKVKRSRSKSREGKDSIIRKFNEREAKDTQNNNNFYQGGMPQQPRRETFVPQRTLFQKDYQAQPSVQDNNLRRDNSRPLDPHFGPRAKASEARFELATQDKGNKLVTGLATYAMTFQSARLESAQCLQTLSLKLNTQISNINYRIDQFRTNMSKILNNQLKALRNQILTLVDEAFKQSQRSIREYMKMEEQKLAGEVIKIREVLEKEYVRVETMKEEIAQPQWRKVTGQILATELEKNLEELVKKSSSVQIGRWQMKNLSGQRLKKLQAELRDLVRLKE